MLVYVCLCLCGKLGICTHTHCESRRQRFPAGVLGVDSPATGGNQAAAVVVSKVVYNQGSDSHQVPLCCQARLHTRSSRPRSRLERGECRSMHGVGGSS